MSPRTKGGPATRGSEILRLVRAADSIIHRDRAASRVAVIAGGIFIVAGLVKFVFHSWELHAFRTFGLPWPSALEILAGLVETAGGALLALRLFVVPVALVLGTTMIVAIAASGVGHGDVIPSLTLAPALLAAMAFLLARAGRARSTLGG
jgi:uncharacterized membrane protein YphA (DoxX/SURF4 family)